MIQKELNQIYQRKLEVDIVFASHNHQYTNRMVEYDCSRYVSKSIAWGPRYGYS